MLSRRRLWVGRRRRGIDVCWPSSAVCRWAHAAVPPSRSPSGPACLVIGRPDSLLVEAVGGAEEATPVPWHGASAKAGSSSGNACFVSINHILVEFATERAAWHRGGRAYRCSRCPAQFLRYVRITHSWGHRNGRDACA